MQKGERADLAVAGAEFAVRVTPRARVASCVLEDGVWKIARRRVTMQHFSPLVGITLAAPQ